MDSIYETTDAWLKTLRLQPHQEPLAALLRTLARRLEDPEEFTAAASDQFRKTIEALTPKEAHRHRSDELTAQITGAAA